MQRKLILALLSLLYFTSTYAQERRDVPIVWEEPEEVAPTPANEVSEIETQPTEKRWTAAVQAGYSYAFGDDNWNISTDRKNAQGDAVSLSIAYKLNRLFDARLKARYLQLFSRVNLEVLEAYRDKYPDFFPRDGFYSYRCLAAEAEALFNLTNLIMPHRKSNLFNIYLIAGAGVNTMMGYEENVSNWDGSYEGLLYHVDTRVHTMPLGVIGGMIDIRLNSDLSVNLEALGTFTGDKMEGVKSEELYDVYVSFSVGLALHF